MGWWEGIYGGYEIPKGGPSLSAPFMSLRLPISRGRSGLAPMSRAQCSAPHPQFHSLSSLPLFPWGLPPLSSSCSPQPSPVSPLLPPLFKW